MSSQQESATTANDIHTVTIHSAKISHILELLAGVRSFPPHSYTSTGQWVTLSMAALEVRLLMQTVATDRMNKDIDTECANAVAVFNKNVAYWTNFSEARSVVEKLDSMNTLAEKLETHYDDKGWEGLQAQVKEVAQIIGKKRKAKEVNGDAGGN